MTPIDPNMKRDPRTGLIDWPSLKQHLGAHGHHHQAVAQATARKLPHWRGDRWEERWAPEPVMPILASQLVGSAIMSLAQTGLVIIDRPIRLQDFEFAFAMGSGILGIGRYHDRMHECLVYLCDHDPALSIEGQLKRKYALQGERYFEPERVESHLTFRDGVTEDDVSRVALAISATSRCTGGVEYIRLEAECDQAPASAGYMKVVNNEHLDAKCDRRDKALFSHLIAWCEPRGHHHELEEKWPFMAGHYQRYPNWMEFEIVDPKQSATMRAMKRPSAVKFVREWLTGIGAPPEMAEHSSFGE